MYYLVTIYDELFGVYKRKWQAKKLRERMLTFPIKWGEISVFSYGPNGETEAHPNAAWRAGVRIDENHFGEIK